MNNKKFTCEEKWCYAYGYFDGRSGIEIDTNNKTPQEVAEYLQGYNDGQNDKEIK
jgi:hypothetical protein